MPGVNYLCMEEIEVKQIRGKVRIKSFNFDLIPINEDLFSLEFSNHLDPL